MSKKFFGDTLIPGVRWTDSDKRKYENELRKMRYLTGETRNVPSWRAHRRIQAMQAMGWSYRAIGEEMGMNRVLVHRILSNDYHVERSVFNRLDRAFHKLAYCRPPFETLHQAAMARTTAREAAERGWATAASWDNIDDPNERPKGIRRGNAGDRRLRTPGRITD